MSQGEGLLRREIPVSLKVCASVISMRASNMLVMLGNKDLLSIMDDYGLLDLRKKTKRACSYTRL